MRRFLIATSLGLGLASAGAAVRQAEAAPFNPGAVELGIGVTPVQYYYGRPRYYAPPPPPPPRYYRPRYYGYYAPPPPPRYYRPRYYYRRW